MTELVVKLPDELARRARNAGLLTDSATQRLREEAMRREAGRALLQVAERLHAAAVEPMSEDEIVAEVKAARAEQRAREATPGAAWSMGCCAMRAHGAPTRQPEAANYVRKDS